MNYYNEIDSFCCDRLENLILEGLIPYGKVDRRSIEDVYPTDLRGFTQCHFFAGVGGWARALQLAGIEPTKPLWTASCPCQPYSTSGKRKGFADERHLWPSFFHLVQAQKPNIVLGEQVANALAWFDLVQCDLDNEGYTIGAAITSAAGAGAPFPRHRLYFVGISERERLPRFEQDNSISSSTFKTPTRCRDDFPVAWRKLETSPLSIPAFDGFPLSVARNFLKMYGNAIVPQQAAAFITAVFNGNY